MLTEVNEKNGKLYIDIPAELFSQIGVTDITEIKIEKQKNGLSIKRR